MLNNHNKLQVLSLNIEHGALAEELLDYLRDNLRDVSVFCFQESDGDIRPEIESMMSDDFDAYHVTKPVVGDQYALSTYVRKGIVVEGTQILFETDVTVGLAMRSTLRIGNGRLVIVTNVYGVSKPGHKLDTSERLMLTRELIRLGSSSTDPQILVGDFNLLPEADSVREFVANGYRNLIDDFKIPTTRNERPWNRYPDTIQLFADYAFVRENRTKYDFVVDTIMVSDHLPLRVMVDLEPADELLAREGRPSILMAGAGAS